MKQDEFPHRVQLAWLKRHYTHAKYVLTHKWYVFIECCRLGIPIRGLVHDWHRFLPIEWIPYSNRFKAGPSTGRDASGHYDPFNTGVTGFDYAWHHHQKRAWHHWQSWCCPGEDGRTIKILEMPMSARKELLADWRGAAKAQGTNDILGHYIAGRNRMLLGPDTRAWLENQVGYVANTGYDGVK